MPKSAVSVTLERENLLWLRGQARVSGDGNLSKVLDRLVAEARTAGRVPEAAARSVVGTVRIAEDDPNLERADVMIRALFGEDRPARGRRPRPDRRRSRRG